jgi:hypothetical protein
LTDLPLNPVPSAAWQQRAAALLADPWLRKKTDRTRRLQEHREHIDRYLPELLEHSMAGTGIVVDVGPGPGEFLELCRHLGHDTQGIDAPTGDGGMGSEYLEYSRLMTTRQEIDVEYVGFEPWICQPHEGKRGTILAVNSRGSIEQALSRHMLGAPHDQHHDCRKLRWSMSADLLQTLDAMFAGLARLLIPGGLFVVVANGAENTAEYDEAMVKAAARTCAFEPVIRFPLDKNPRLLNPAIHKWRRI